MPKSIAIIGTLDTKGDQLEYLKQLIEERGQKVIFIDVGVLGEPFFEPTITKQQVAQASGSNVEEIIALKDECKAMNKMAEGASKVVKDLYSNDKLSGILAVGGSMGTDLALKVMEVLPIGIPKLILSTVAFSPAITADMVGGDLMMLPWVGGLWKLNSLSRQALEKAAGAISGAAEIYDKDLSNEKNVVGVTAHGETSCWYMNPITPALEERGYQVAMFHTTGMGGRLFERAIADGLIAASLDIAVGSELVNEIAGGVGSAGKHRLEAAGKMGIPQIVSPGFIDAFHWGGDQPLPARYKERPHHLHNRLLNVIISSTSEKAAAGELMAEKLNQAKGPTAVVIPMKGVRPRRIPGAIEDPFFESILNAEPGFKAFHKALIKTLKPQVKVVVLDAGLNDLPYIEKVLALFDEMMKG